MSETTMTEDLADSALRYHRLPRPGKIEVVPTKPLATQRDLSLAAALRRLAEPLVPQSGDRVLQLLDQQRAVLGFALRSRRPRLGRHHRLAQRQDRRVRRGQV